MPAGFLVFLWLIGTLGGVNDRLIQFQLLPCGAVQPLDFFDHIVGVGGCDTLAQLFPAFLGFGGNAQPLQWGHSFAWLTHLRSHRYHLILTGHGLSAIRCAPGENIQSQADQQRHIDAKHLGLGSVVHKTFYAGFTDRKICSRRIMDGSSNAGLGSTSTWVGCFFFFSVRVVTVATINVGE